MKKVLPVEKYYHLINHGPCVLITATYQTQRNICPIAWTTPLNDEPPLVIICVASSHFTSQLIDKSKEFVINIPSVEMLDVIKNTGTTSGKKVDKFKTFNIEVDDGVKINTVHLKNCVGFIEAKVVFKKEFKGVNLYVGEVLHCEVEKDVYKDNLIPQKAKTVHHIGANKFFISSETV